MMMIPRKLRDDEIKYIQRKTLARSKIYLWSPLSRVGVLQTTVLNVWLMGLYGYLDIIDIYIHICLYLYLMLLSLKNYKINKLALIWFRPWQETYLSFPSSFHIEWIFWSNEQETSGLHNCFISGCKNWHAYIAISHKFIQHNIGLLKSFQLWITQWEIHRKQWTRS